MATIGATHVPSVTRKVDRTQTVFVTSNCVISNFNSEISARAREDPRKLKKFKCWNIVDRALGSDDQRSRSFFNDRSEIGDHILQRDRTGDRDRFFT